MSRRSAPRYEVELSVQLVTTAAVRGVSRNISTSGILVHATRPLPKGTRVRLEPLLSGGTAEVVWVRETKENADDPFSEADIGLKFVLLPQHDRETISALVESLRRSDPNRWH
jgi:hypothetical protein